MVWRRLTLAVSRTLVTLIAVWAAIWLLVIVDAWLSRYVP
jgi:hypothetical protein